MANSPTHPGGTQAYPGPSQAELGSLADWVNPTEFSQLQAGVRPARAPATLPTARPPHRRRPERYSGPTPEELGDLAAWLAPGNSHPSAPVSDPHVDTAIRSIEAELWVSETSAQPDRPPLSGPPPPAVGPRRADPDPFLDQLDEIQVALRKRPRG